MATGWRRNSLRFVIVAAAVLAGFEAAAEPFPPSISSVVPSILNPRGGEMVTITGSSFRSTARVFFDLGHGGAPVEAFVTSLSPTTINAVTPQVDAGPRGWLLANVIVISSSGSSLEGRAMLTNGVRFESSDLAPNVMAVSPSSVSRAGGTVVTIFGDGFQEPVQVFAVHPGGSQSEMQVIGVRFDQVRVVTPGADRDETAGLRVVNVGTGQSFTLAQAFLYVAPIAPMSIGSVTPSVGPYSGGTRVTIQGSRFSNPVAVAIGGVAAQTFETSEDHVIVVTGPLLDPQCSDHSDAIAVVNGHGASASGAPFTFTTPRSDFRFVPSQATAGSLVTVIVRNDVDLMRFLLNDTPVDIESRIESGDGSATYRLRIPASLVFSGGGCLPAPLAMTLRMTNPGTGCHDARPLYVVPEQNSGRCRLPREIQ
jgi:hypothetical protein